MDTATHDPAQPGGPDDDLSVSPDAMRWTLTIHGPATDPHRLPWRCRSGTAARAASAGTAPSPPRSSSVD